MSPGGAISATPPGRSLRSATLPVSRGEIKRSAADQRAAAFLERTECLFRRDGGAQVVEIARALGLFRLLDLEQIGRMQRTPVGADRTLAEHRVVGRHLLHLRDNGLAVGGAFERGNRLEVMQ